MQTAVTVGLDIAKNVFQAHGVDDGMKRRVCRSAAASVPGANARKGRWISPPRGRTL
jgi:transposase